MGIKKKSKAKDEILITLYSRNKHKISEGTLFIKKGRLPYVILELSKTIEKYWNNTMFYCFCYDKQQWYTLLNTDVRFHQYLYPLMVIEGKVSQGYFKRIQVELGGVSEWMNPLPYPQDIDNAIRINTSSVNFNECITVKGSQIQISSHRHCRAGWSRRKVRVKPRTFIELTNTSGKFSVEDAIEYSYKISRLFSILLGAPLNISHVSVGGTKNVHTAHFSRNAVKKTRVKNMEYFIRPESIYDDNLWELIFHNFFNNSNFENIWNRVVGMFNYQGYFETEILSYVALVDRYISSFSKAYDSKVSKSKFRSYRKEIESAVNNILVNTDETGAERDVLESLKRQVKYLRNTKYPTFHQQFALCRLHMDKGIVDIIGLKPEHVEHIVSIRNQVAHGSMAKFSEKRNFTYESVIKSKLALLLMYWALRDLGFTDQMFINQLYSSHSDIVRRAYVNRDLIDELSGEYIFLNVDSVTYERLKKPYKDKVIALEYDSGLNVFVQNESANLLINEFYNQKPIIHRTFVDYLNEHYKTEGEETITYMDRVFIQHGNNKIKIRGFTMVCILNCPNEILNVQTGSNNFRRYVCENGQWREHS